MANFKKIRWSEMNVELVLARRMLKRSLPIYTLVPIFFLIKSQESMVTSLVSGLIVASGFYLGAFLMSFAAKVSLNFYYFSALFGYVARLIYIFGFLLLFRSLYPIDEMAMSMTVPIVFLSMLFLEMAMVIKRKDTDLDWANDNSS
ncbi:MAG: hypothetical protein H8D44_02105 [Actinobacteria bacterium]|nr:hypothetical protein [Actinomycetota bacterium]MBL6833560.1 hypothetical protein [Candidatus Actinomarina sp.]